MRMNEYEIYPKKYKLNIDKLLEVVFNKNIGMYNKNDNALVVKLVDTTDLKSVPFWSASSSLAEGTTK